MFSMPSIAIEVFEKLDRDVEVLLSLHSGSGTPGRPSGNNGPLLRSALVLLVTAWENYIEQVTGEVYDHVSPIIAADPSLLPAYLKDAVSKKAKESAWAVVGNGWLAVAKKRFEYEIDSFNNAASRQVNELIDRLLGIPNVLDLVSWQGVGSAKAQAELTELVNDIRGEIVHKGTTPGELDLPGVRSWRRYMGNLVRSYDKALSSAVVSRYRSCSW